MRRTDLRTPYPFHCPHDGEPAQRDWRAEYHQAKAKQPRRGWLARLLSVLFRDAA